LVMLLMLRVAIFTPLNRAERKGNCETPRGAYMDSARFARDLGQAFC
jgi:hypothetical protein